MKQNKIRLWIVAEYITQERMILKLTCSVTAQKCQNVPQKGYLANQPESSCLNQIDPER